MTTEEFKYVTDWLYGLCADDYNANEKVKEYAEKSFKPLKGVISSLWAMMDRRIFGCKDKVLRYASDRIYAYNGKWYVEESAAVFMEELVRRVLAKLGTQPVYQLEAKKIAQPLLNRLMLTPEYTYEPNRRWICFTNGMYDLESRKFEGRHNINWVTDLILDMDYNPRASSTMWNIKLKQIIPDVGFQGDFQQFCGALLASRERYKVEYICYLYGTGGNGKSVLASAISSAFGSKFVSAFSLDQIFTTQTNSMFIANEMNGKLLNVCDDVDEKDVSGGNFKRFVSREKMPARAVFGKVFTKANPPMLLCCINTFPDTIDDSEGNHRRQLIIETTPKKWEGNECDTQLSAKFASVECRQAIFNWILDGYRKYVLNGGAIKLSESAIEARKYRKADSSPMRRWAADRGFTKAVPENNKDPRWMKAETLYADFKKYCADNGYKSWETSARKITEMLRSMGCIHKNVNGRGFKICVGSSGVDTDEAGRLLDIQARQTLE